MDYSIAASRRVGRSSALLIVRPSAADIARCWVGMGTTRAGMGMRSVIGPTKEGGQAMDEDHTVDDARSAPRPSASAVASTGMVSGGVRTLLRVEGAFILAAAVLAYRAYGQGWAIFAVAFLAPDLSFLGYLAGPRIGAAVYNAAHVYVGPLACLAVAVLLQAPTWLGAGLIWGAHIGMDRALGYGLKYGAGFGVTHLGGIGRGRVW